MDKAMSMVKPLQDQGWHLQRHVKAENKRERVNHRTPEVTRRVPEADRGWGHLANS